MPPPNQTRFDAGRFAGRMFPLSQEEIDSMNGRQMLAVLAQMASSTASVRGSPRHHEGTGIAPRAPTRATDDDVFPATHLHDPSTPSGGMLADRAGQRMLTLPTVDPHVQEELTQAESDDGGPSPPRSPQLATHASQPPNIEEPPPARDAQRIDRRSDAYTTQLRRKMGIDLDRDPSDQDLQMRNLRSQVQRLAGIDGGKTWRELKSEGKTEAMVSSIPPPPFFQFSS